MTDSSLLRSSGADAQHDFDFLFGRWLIRNQRLGDPLDRASAWSEFEATSQVGPILGGFGNYQTFDAPTFPQRSGYQGYALRLLDPETTVWRIWWASTEGRGQLDTPVVGTFRNGVGRFESDEVMGGRVVKVRFLWKDITEASARWEQAFSFDGGRTFDTNWIMLHERLQ